MEGVFQSSSVNFWPFTKTISVEEYTRSEAKFFFLHRWNVELRTLKSVQLNRGKHVRLSHACCYTPVDRVAIICQYNFFPIILLFRTESFVKRSSNLKSSLICRNTFVQFNKYTSNISHRFPWLLATFFPTRDLNTNYSTYGVEPIHTT